MLELEPHQRALLDELQAKDSLLSQMYRGALFVLGDNENPDRCHLASHNLRELMDRLPAFLGVDNKEWRTQLGHKLSPLSEEWDVAKTQSANRTAAKKWSGEIDGPLQRFLRKAEEFFEWLDEHRPRRRAIVRQALDEMDIARLPPPSPIQALGVKEWMAYHEYFVRVAHHHSYEEEEFEAYVLSLEHYLLDRLRPRTFKEIDEIREVIHEGESLNGP